MGDSALTTLTQQQLRDVEIIARRSPVHEVPDALKRMRAMAQLTMRQVGNRFSRKPSCVANWEAGKNLPGPELIPGLLELFRVPTSVIAQFNIEVDGDLDPAIYARGNATVIEYDWWQRKRGPALQALYVRAVEGSESAMKLLFERGDKITVEHAAQLSRPKAVGDSSTQSADWTKRALKPATTVALEASAIVEPTTDAG